jgi:hypothetical protein
MAMMSYSNASRKTGQAQGPFRARHMSGPFPRLDPVTPLVPAPVCADGRTLSSRMHFRRKTGPAEMAVVISIALLPFYLWESGLPQPSHVALALTALFIAVTKGISNQPIPVIYSAVALVTYITNIDLIVYIYHGDATSLTDAAFWIYNTTVMIVLRAILVARWSTLSLSLSRTIVSMFIIEMLVILLGYGSQIGYRALGTFNDPNQMAMWVLSMLGVVMICSPSSMLIFIAFILAAVLIGLASSRSGALGMLAISACVMTYMVKCVAQYTLQRVPWRYVYGVAALMLVVFAIVLLQGELIANFVVENWSLLAERFREQDVDDALAGRGYDRLWLYPEYLFFGAGQGAFDRFAASASRAIEIHSSWAGLLFQYGIVGSALFVCFMWAALRGAGAWIFAALTGIVLFGFFTYGLRNSSVWILLAVASAAAARRRIGAARGEASNGRTGSGGGR